MQISSCKDSSSGSLNPKNAKYIIDNLNFGIAECLRSKKVGLVTGPIQKSNIINGGFKNFQGHTSGFKRKQNLKMQLCCCLQARLKLL